MVDPLHSWADIKYERRINQDLPYCEVSPQLLKLKVGPSSGAEV